MEDMANSLARIKESIARVNRMLEALKEVTEDNVDNGDCTVIPFKRRDAK